MRFRSMVLLLAMAGSLLTAPGLAQADSCPILSDAAAGNALGGGAIHTEVSPTNGNGTDECDFVDPTGADYGVERELGVFQASDPASPVSLAQKALQDLAGQPDSSLAGLNQPGTHVTLVGYDLASVTGVGDVALTLQVHLEGGSVEDGLLVRRGTDVFAFETFDRSDAQTKLNALAQAVLTSS